MSNCITIHQPQYLPWIPYFSKVLSSDYFVVLDNVSFQKNGLQNRNQIKTSSGKLWLTVPVKQSFGQLIKDVEIADTTILKKHLKTLEYNYQKAPYFNEVGSFLFPILSSNVTCLSELNFLLIQAILKYLKYDGKIYLGSDLNVSGKKSELIRNICLALNARKYISGPGGLEYLDVNDFNTHGIDICFHQNRLPHYTQLHVNLPFYNDLSIIDFLFNVGEAARIFLMEKNDETENTGCYGYSS